MPDKLARRSIGDAIQHLDNLARHVDDLYARDATEPEFYKHSFGEDDLEAHEADAELEFEGSVIWIRRTVWGTFRYIAVLDSKLARMMLGMELCRCMLGRTAITVSVSRDSNEVAVLSHI